MMVVVYYKIGLTNYEDMYSESDGRALLDKERQQLVKLWPLQWVVMPTQQDLFPHIIWASLGLGRRQLGYWVVFQDSGVRKQLVQDDTELPHVRGRCQSGARILDLLSGPKTWLDSLPYCRMVKIFGKTWVGMMSTKATWYLCFGPAIFHFDVDSFET
jgi:hypothetical protein